jgi:hypothetical protein
MAIIISAVRAYLLSDAQDKPLAFPQILDLAKEAIPYGARVRLEADIEGGKPAHPLWATVAQGDIGLGRLLLLPTDGASTYRAEARLPLGFIHWSGELFGLKSTLTFPNDQWLNFSGGRYVLRLVVQPVASSEADILREMAINLGTPPAKGGAAPGITRLEGPPGGVLRVGQPWLATATVADADNVAAVVFSVLRDGTARWSFMADDGSLGDVKAGDGIYSKLLVGGGWWDCGDSSVTQDSTITLTAQAVDLQGNWSAPVSLQYTVLFSEPPLWMEEPSPEGHNILQGEVDRAKGIPGYPLFQAQCDNPEAWVCVRLIAGPDPVFPLYDNGLWPDATAGDGIHATLAYFYPYQEREIVFYAVPKQGGLGIGKKLAALCPPGKW